MNKTYIKQHCHQNIGHAYEHAVLSLFETAAFSRGSFRAIDYNWYAEVHNGIIFINIITESKKLLNIFTNTIKKSPITDDLIIRSVNEISCEYQKPFTYDLSDLRNEIITLHNSNWSTYDNLNMTKKLIESSWNDECSSLIFKKQHKSDYVNYEFVYTFNNLKPELKPLAVYLMQSMAIAQIDHLYHRTPEITGCYDRGDQWAEWQFEQGIDLVGYSHIITISKTDSTNVKLLKDIFHRNLGEIINNGFKQKLIKFLKKESTDDIKYFSQKNIINYSGYLVGKLWYQKYCNLKNIEYLFDNIEINITRLK